jgi:hypothetical protein
MYNTYALYGSIKYITVPVSKIIIIQELYFQNYHNLGNHYLPESQKENAQLSKIAKYNKCLTPLFQTISGKPLVSQIMIIQELYFQNYYNLGNPNRLYRKNKMPNFPRWPNAT